MEYSSFVTPLLETAFKAGGIIMEYYNDDVEINFKEDQSPVTEADIAANNFIVAKLKEISPEIPIISEEDFDNDSVDGNIFWLVDPLDGTKSFIKRTGEFTVNIGLIKNKTPILGIVYVPVKDAMYYTGEDGKAYIISNFKDNTLPKEINIRQSPSDGLTVVASQSHRTQETDDYIADLNVKEFISASSSLKFCLLAEGKADIYPRFGPTMEWDTAAAHAVLLAAGGSVTKIDGSDFTYAKDGFKNTYFIAWGDKF